MGSIMESPQVDEGKQKGQTAALPSRSNADHLWFEELPAEVMLLRKQIPSSTALRFTHLAFWYLLVVKGNGFTSS